MPLTYLVGDATAPEGPGPFVIAHVCNDAGGWGKGFVLALSRRWKEPERAYRQWFRTGRNFSLGQVQFVTVDDTIVVANMIAQHRFSDPGNPVYLRYPALRTCLSAVADYAAGKATVSMPRIGTGLAGGQWELVLPIIEEELVDRGAEVVVYDLARR